MAVPKLEGGGGGQGAEKFALTTELNLLQRSILSPFLFNIFIKDTYQYVQSKKVMFADGGTVWKSRKIKFEGTSSW